MTNEIEVEVGDVIVDIGTGEAHVIVKSSFNPFVKEQRPVELIQVSDTVFVIKNSYMSKKVFVSKNQSGTDWSHARNVGAALDGVANHIHIAYEVPYAYFDDLNHTFNAERYSPGGDFVGWDIEHLDQKEYFIRRLQGK